MKRDIGEKNKINLPQGELLACLPLIKKEQQHTSTCISSNPVTRASCFTFPVDWTRPGRSLRVRTQWRER